MRSESSFIATSRRRQIVDGAIETLAETGYAATSLNTIATRIGVSKGVISYHFAGKDELLGAVVSTVLADAAAFMTPRIVAAASHTEALRAYIEANCDFIADHHTALVALNEVVNGSRVAAVAFAEQQATAVEDLMMMFRRGIAAGEFGGFTAIVAARSLRAAIDVVSIAPPPDLTAYAGELVRLFLHGVAA